MALIAQGTSQAEVARQLGVTREAVRQWVGAWRNGGPAALASRPRQTRGRVPLSSLAETIDRGRAGSASLLSTEAVRDLVARAHGVTYSASSVRAILRRLGYVYSREEGWLPPSGQPGSQGALRTG
jgi:transposase